MKSFSNIFNKFIQSMLSKNLILMTLILFLLKNNLNEQVRFISTVKLFSFAELTCPRETLFRNNHREQRFKFAEFH